MLSKERSAQAIDASQARFEKERAEKESGRSETKSRG
jgi:hypothetical protein